MNNNINGWTFKKTHKKLNTRCDIINREISTIVAKTQIGKEQS